MAVDWSVSLDDLPDQTEKQGTDLLSSLPDQPEVSIQADREPEPSKAKQLWDNIISITKQDPKAQAAKAQNALALSDLLGISPTQAYESHDELAKELNLYDKGPSGFELAGYGLLYPMATAVMSNPVSAGLGLAAYQALAEAESKAISMYQNKKYVPFRNRGLTALLPEDTNEITTGMVDIFDILAKGVGVAGLAKGRKPIWEKFTKDIITEYKLPRDVFIPAKAIKSIFQTGEHISPGELELVTSLGLSGPKYRDATNQGLWIRVPGEKIVTISDRPYWAKLKEYIGIKPYQKSIITKMGKPEQIASGLALPKPEGRSGYAEGARGETLAGGAEERPQGQAAGGVRLWDAQKAGMETRLENKIRYLDIQGASRIDTLTKVVDRLPVLEESQLYDPSAISPDEALEIGRTYYEELSSQAHPAPAFHGQDVRFDENGWEHFFMADLGKQRSRQAVIDRISLLPRAKTIIENIPYVSDIRILADGKEMQIRPGDTIRFPKGGSIRYGLMGRFADGQALQVVIEERRIGDKSYFSVFEVRDVSRRLRRSAAAGGSSEPRLSMDAAAPHDQGSIPSDVIIGYDSENVKRGGEPGKGKVTRENFAGKIQEAMGISDEEASAVQAIVDARAEAWSKMTGRPAGEYYPAHFEDIVKGGKPGSGTGTVGDVWNAAINGETPTAQRSPDDQARGSAVSPDQSDNIIGNEGKSKRPDELYQLRSVTREVTVNWKTQEPRTYEVSIQPEVLAKAQDELPQREITSVKEARELNANEERVKDWQEIYAKAGVLDTWDSVKKVNKVGKLEGVAVVSLTKGCQRTRVVIERISNGLLPNETRVEACYGGDCWVNKQFNAKFGSFENMEVRDLQVANKEKIREWLAKPKTQEWLNNAVFIRMGQQGCDSHTIATGLALEWLKACKEFGIKKKTIFISAGYAPVTKAQYKALAPYKNLFEIHFNLSGWFHKNEILLRLAEFKEAKDAGIPAKIRVITNRDAIDGISMPNEAFLFEQLQELGVTQGDLLETPFHDDSITKGPDRSEPTGDFKNVCCETGKCKTCGVKCMVGAKGKGEKFEPDMSNVLYQEKQVVDPWFSQLENTIKSSKFPNRAPGDQMAQVLESWSKSGEIKAEEIEWSGVLEWLRAQDGKVTREQVLEYLQANNVRVQEIVKGNSPSRELEQLYYERGVFRFRDEPVPEDLERKIQELEAKNDTTTYEDYTLPGGEHYRELLLTIPEVTPTELPEGFTLKENPAKVTAERHGSQWIVEGPSSENGIDNRYAHGRTPEEAIDNFYRTHKPYGDKSSYWGPHWAEPNVLAHVRFDERIDADGKRLLFIEEIQSDWHQQGRKMGYKTGNGLPPGWTVRKDTGLNPWVVLDQDGNEARFRGPTKEQAIRNALPDAGVPNAPFKKTWPMLAIKRMVRWAAENGFDRIAWTTREQQAERYDLSKQISKIGYEPIQEPEGTYELVAYDLKGNQVLHEDKIPLSRVEELVGKEIAKKVENLEGEHTGGKHREWRELSGLDLKVGGEGMKVFYDQILPSEVIKFFGKKKWGSPKVGETKIIALEEPDFSGLDPLERRSARTEFLEEAERTTVHYLDITPEMKEKALGEGMPLFAASKKGSTEFLENGRAIIRGLSKPDVSTAVHELAHVFRHELGQTDPEGLREVESEFGVRDGKWSRAAEEDFADQFVFYLHAGEAPSEKLKSIFERFKEWLTKIYRKIIGTAAEKRVSPRVKAFFDEMLGGKQGEQKGPREAVQDEIDGSKENSTLVSQRTKDDIDEFIAETNGRVPELEQPPADQVALLEKEYLDLPAGELEEADAQDLEVLYQTRQKLRHLRHMRQRQELMEQVREIRARLKARAEIREKSKKWIDRLRKVKIDELPRHQRDNVKALLEGFAFRGMSRKTRLQLEETRAFLKDNPNCELPDNVLEDLDRLDKKNIRDLSYKELESLYMAVMHEIRIASDKKKIRVGKQMTDFNFTLSKAINEMRDVAEVEDIKIDGTEMKERKSVIALIKNILWEDSLHYDLLVEMIAGKNSIIDKVFFADIKEGINRQLRYRQQVFDRFRADLDEMDFFNKHHIEDHAAWLDESITVGRITLTRNQRMSLYRHSLNKDNRLALLQGGFGFRNSKDPNRIYVITYEEFIDILNSLDPAEIEYASAPVDRLVKENYEALNEVFEAKNGYDLPRVEDGPYWPKRVMSISRSDLGQEEADTLDALKGRWIRPGVDKGMLKKRVGSAKPIYLDSLTETINSIVMRSSAYIGLEIPLSNASKLLYNQHFAAEVEKRYGRDIWKAIENGLRDIAGEYRTYTTIEQFLMKAKNSLVSAIFGANPFVMAKQLLAYPLYLPYVDMEYLLEGLLKYIEDPDGVTNLLKKLSPEYRERLEGGYSRDVADVFKSDASRRITGQNTTLSEKFCAGIRLFDRVAVTPGMYGAFLQALAEIKAGKMSPGVAEALDMTNMELMLIDPKEYVNLAIKYAEYATERTQPMFGPEHRSAFDRGNFLQRALTMFTASTNAMFNMVARSIMAYKRNPTSDNMRKIFWSLVAIFVINTTGNAVVDEIRDRMYGRPGKSIPQRILDDWSGIFYFIRDLVPSITSHLERGPYGGYDPNNPMSKLYDLAVNIPVYFFMAIHEWYHGRTSKAEKYFLRFLDYAAEAFLTSRGIPYATPKKMIEAGYEAVK